MEGVVGLHIPTPLICSCSVLKHEVGYYHLAGYALFCLPVTAVVRSNVDTLSISWQSDVDLIVFPSGRNEKWLTLAIDHHTVTINFFRSKFCFGVCQCVADWYLPIDPISVNCHT